jgi:hypothetical protein
MGLLKLVVVSILKLLLNSGTVKTTCGINLEIDSKFEYCRKLLLVSILKSIVNLGTVEKTTSRINGILLVASRFLLASPLVVASADGPTLCSSSHHFLLYRHIHACGHGKVCSSTACRPIYQVECTMILRSSFQ